MLSLGELNDMKCRSNIIGTQISVTFDKNKNLVVLAILYMKNTKVGTVLLDAMTLSELDHTILELNKARAELLKTEKECKQRGGFPTEAKMEA